MRGADEFVALIGTRERELAAALFAAPPSGAARERALAALPPSSSP
jgi:hypothetical protein